MEKENRNKEKSAILIGKEAEDRYAEIKSKGLLLFEAIVGSTAYGTNIPTSDIDKKFIYIETLDNILAGNASLQLNLTDDYVGYELGRYLDLLRTQNPNIIELLNADEQHIEFCHPLFRELVLENRNSFLSDKVAFSFGEYSRSQIKKAQGTNKKFMNPMPKERKTLMDFCWVGHKQGSIALRQYLDDNNQIMCGGKKQYIPEWMYGCVAIEHMKNTYHLFFDEERMYDFATHEDEMYRDNLFARREFQGIVDKDGVQVKLSSVPKGMKPMVTFYCNVEGYSFYCKEYKEYWEWMERRNEQRFVENAENEHNYDRKNMMHCHRLLDMCIEILKGEGVKVLRPNREELLGIRLGSSTYQELVDKAEEKYNLIQELHKTTELPEKCDKSLMDGILLQFRKRFYNI